MNNVISFPEPLKRARVINRPNRFIVWAELNGEEVKCHCPVSGRIGGLTLDGLEILLSGPYPDRGTAYTVEAVALEPETSPTFQWIGLNQTKCNAYVEEFLKRGLLSSTFPEANRESVRREKKLGDSRIDFLVNDNTFIEVKMPVLKLHTVVPDSVPIKIFPPGNPSERLPKQMKDMTNAIGTGMRGAMLVCFQYRNTAGTDLQSQLHDNIFPDEALLEAKRNGLEQYVCEMEFTPSEVRFKAVRPAP